MRVRSWDLSTTAIKEALEEQGTVYRGEQYSGLVSNASVDVPAACTTELEREMAAVWQWNRQWHSLYADHLAAREESHWLVRATEWGLPPKALTVQRLPDVLARDPHVGRVDSVALDPVQQIAEVQWKGGGEGFAAGLQSAYLRLRPPGIGEGPLGDRLVDGWSKLFRRHARGDVAFVVNSSRDTWAPSERYLVEALRERGVELMFVPRSSIGSVIKVADGRVLAPFEGGWHAIDFLYLDRLSEALPTELFDALIGVYRNGGLHVDPPPTYLYSQKLGFALPFHPEYRARFTDEARALLIPTALVESAPDLTPILSKVDHPKRDLLAELRSWDDLQRLPVGLRRRLVVKCGSVNGRLNNAGRGVWRLGTAATLEAVLDRVRSRGEPWLIQPYVNRTWDVPLSHPDEGRNGSYPVHGRFLVYCGQAGGRFDILGGLVTFSRFWKAAGKDASSVDGDGVGGSAFVDIRVRPD